MKLCPWILAQLMLHPVAGVGKKSVTCVLTSDTLHHLAISASQDPFSKLALRDGDPLLAGGLIDPIEKGQPGCRIGQQRDGWRFMNHDYLHSLWRATENLKGDKRPRAT